LSLYVADEDPMQYILEMGYFDVLSAQDAQAGHSIFSAIAR
jgi:hypothetical protein